MEDKNNVPLEEVAVELHIPAEVLENAIAAIRRKHKLADGEPLRVEVPTGRVTLSSHLAQTSAK